MDIISRCWQSDNLLGGSVLKSPQECCANRAYCLNSLTQSDYRVIKTNAMLWLGWKNRNHRSWVKRLRKLNVNLIITLLFEYSAHDALVSWMVRTICIWVSHSNVSSRVNVHWHVFLSIRYSTSWSVTCSEVSHVVRREREVRQISGASSAIWMIWFLTKSLNSLHVHIQHIRYVYFRYDATAPVVTLCSRCHMSDWLLFQNTL